MTKLPYELFVALRYLRSKRKEVFISIITVVSVLGVAISVMVLDIALAIMTGLESELKSKLVDAGAHIVLRKFGGDIENPQAVIDQLKGIQDVVSVSPFTYNQALVTTTAGARGLLIRGFPDGAAVREKMKRMSLSDEDLNQLFSPPPIDVERPDGTTDSVVLPPLIVGRALEEQLHVFPGSPVTVFSPQLGNSPQGLVPRARRFLVVGVYRSGLREFEAGLAYTSLGEAQRFFGMADSVTGLEIMVRDMFRAHEMIGAVMSRLGEDAPQYYATDWTEPNKPLWDAMKLEKQVYFVVLLLLILIASFSIVSTLVMVVIEKSRDVAVMKSIGATNGVIMRIFLFQGAIIGTLGVVCGTVLGYCGCLGLRRYGWPMDEQVFGVSTLPVHMEWSNFVIVLGCAWVITLLAGVYPALRASRLSPADALRFE